MARGGKRDGAGRKAGSANKRSKQLEEQIAILAKTKRPSATKPAIGLPKPSDEDANPVLDLPYGDDLLPLEFLLAVLRDPVMPFTARFEAAEKAAPYCHSKMSTVDVNAKVQTISHEDALKALAADPEDPEDKE